MIQKFATLSTHQKPSTERTGQASRRTWIRFVLAAVLLGAATAAHGSILTPVTVSGSAGVNGGFGPGNSVDNTSAEYATGGAGIATFLHFDFGAPVTIDRLLPIQRDSLSAGDRFGSLTYTFSADASFGGADPTVTFAALNSPATGAIQSISPQTAQYVRFDVNTIIDDGANNTGARELIFLATPAGAQIAMPTIIGASAAFSAETSVANIQDLAAGSQPADFHEFASSFSGTATFVDFDFGIGGQTLMGFDYIDRVLDGAKITGFDLLLSDDPTFTLGVTTKSYVKGATELFETDTFAPIAARYVRFDVTGIASDGRVGGSELIFYTVVPEPSSFALMLFGSLALLSVRRVERHQGVRRGRSGPWFPIG